jgi:hypothetical protein
MENLQLSLLTNKELKSLTKEELKEIKNRPFKNGCFIGLDLSELVEYQLD